MIILVWTGRGKEPGLILSLQTVVGGLGNMYACWENRGRWWCHAIGMVVVGTVGSLAM